MRIAYCSDLHLEFGDLELKNTLGAEVLVLAGDVCVAVDLQNRDTYNVLGEGTKSAVYHKFFQNCCAQFPVVIYIAGNHEHYHGDFADTYARLRDKLGYLKNLYILDKEVLDVTGTRFICGTLWTNIDVLDQPRTAYTVKTAMNDFRVIKNSLNKLPFSSVYEVRSPKFMVEDATQEHRLMVKKIEDNVQGCDRVVVVSHHTPSLKCVHANYAGDVLNAAYHTDLEWLMHDYPQIKAWVCGHTHTYWNFSINQTQVLCNPRGYHKYEQCADEFTLEYYDIS